MENNACAPFLRQMDAYLDPGAPTFEGSDLAAHLSGCRACSAEFELRRSLRARLRTAARADQAPPHLRAQIRMAMDAPPPRHWLNRAMLPAGALATAFLGVVVAYQLGHLRFTQASQDSFVTSVSNRVASIMRVGLRDHVHCAVFGKFPRNGTVSATLAKDPEYRDLLPLVKDTVPAAYRLEAAHRCREQGRKFVHLLWRGEGGLVSLVVAMKGEGESFQTEELIPALVHSGLPVYRTASQKFQVAGFETSRHLVYVVSDLSREQNTDLMLAMAPTVRGLLERPL